MVIGLILLSLLDIIKKVATFFPPSK